LFLLHHGEAKERTTRRIQKQQAGILDDLPVAWCYDDGQGEFNIDATIQRGRTQEYATRDSVIQCALDGADPDEEVSLEDEAEYDSDRVLRLLTCRGWLDVEEFIRDKQGNYPSDDNEDGDSSIGKTRLAGMSSFVSKKMLVRGTYGEP
jgi:hypothetical protein